VVDCNGNTQDSLAYNNEVIEPGDIILMVDGHYVQKMSVEKLHKLLQGPLNSVVGLELAKKDTGRSYKVMIMRHLNHQFAKPDTERQKTVQAEGTIPTSALLGALNGFFGSFDVSDARQARTPRTPMKTPGSQRNLLGSGGRPSSMSTTAGSDGRIAFCGLQLTSNSPYSVVSAANVQALDEQRQPIETSIQNGDTLVHVEMGTELMKVDGLKRDDVDAMMRGNFMSSVKLGMKTTDGTLYDVRLRRHTFQPDSQSAVNGRS